MASLQQTIMVEEMKLNKIVSNIIGENSYSHCRLCLKDVAEESYLRFEDAVATSDTEDSDSLPIKDVLSSVLGLETEVNNPLTT